jgi:hypothetical protein
MRLIAVTALVFAQLSGALLAEDVPRPMTEQEFAARVTGKTFFFSQSGQSFGAESYGSDRSVTWTYGDGACVDGGWYAEDDQICFAYLGNDGEPICWHFFDTGETITARIVGADPSEDLTVTGEIDKILPCMAPGLDT